MSMSAKHTFLIKIGKWLYINPLTLLLFVFCYINRHLELLAITYIIMLAHELAHLAAALFIGLMPSHIVIEPFGVNLRLRNRIVYSLTDETILYLSGPLINIVLALIATIINKYFQNEWIYDFAVKNLALFTINMLPILPLDGGVLAKKLFCALLGSKIADTVIKLISCLLLAILSVFGFILAYKSNFNFSVVFLCIFLLVNILVQKEKYNIDFVKELMFYKKKSDDYKHKRVRLIAASEFDSARSIAEKFTRSTFCIAFILNKHNKLKNIVTEPELMDMIMENGADSTFSDTEKTNNIHIKKM